MNDERLAELKEKYKDRSLLEELAWGIYANHSGYTSKQNGEFLNWLCMMAYKALKDRPKGECRTCRHRDPEDKKCDCGGMERQGCPFPVSDNYFCKYYEESGAE